MKLLKRYGKHIMAIASALLMIVFFLPSGMRHGGGGNQVVGYLGNSDKLYAYETQNARQAWQLLNQRPIDYMGRTPGTLLLGADAASQISQHDDLFALLLHEASGMGVIVTNDEVETVLRNDLPKDYVQPEMADDFRIAVTDALMVQKAFIQAASVIKVSQPMRRHDLATMLQQISINLVEFDAANYKAKVPAPTEQQLTELFKKYRDTIAGDPTESNPFGFGYKYPNRVKLQYIEVPRSEVRRAVQASKTEHRWEVDSYKYYVQHQSQFSTTQPASTQPDNSSSMSLDTAAKAPTTRPFQQVADQIKQELIDQESNKLQMQIFEKISAALGGDYMAFRSAVPEGTTQPTTVPSSSVRTPYNTFDYLKALAAQVQAENGALPVVTSINDHFVSPQGALKLPGIGDAQLGREDLATYLQSAVAAFNPAQQSGNRLTLWQPSQALKDNDDNLFILRITAAEPAHQPATLAEVQQQVQHDWIEKQAYALARAAADKLLAEAKVDGLRSAARQDNLKVVTTGAFLNRPSADIPGYNLPADAKQPFIEGSFKLLSTPRVQPGFLPLRVVEMPQAGLADAAELVSVTPMYKAQDEQMAIAEADQFAIQQQAQRFIRDWFDYQSVVSRLEYRPQQTNNNPSEPQGPNPAEQPVF